MPNSFNQNFSSSSPMKPDESDDRNSESSYNYQQCNDTSIEEVEYDLKLVDFFGGELVEQETLQTSAHVVTHLDNDDDDDWW